MIQFASLFAYINTNDTNNLNILSVQIKNQTWEGKDMLSWFRGEFGFITAWFTHIIVLLLEVVLKSYTAPFFSEQRCMFFFVILAGSNIQDDLKVLALGSITHL